MSYNSEVTLQKITLISKRVLSLMITTAVLDSLAGGAMIFLGLKWKLIELTAVVLFIFAALLLMISWITPGIFIILRTPWFARAWLRGINPILISDKAWEQLSNGEKIAVYFYAILFLAVTLIIILEFISHFIYK